MGKIHPLVKSRFAGQFSVPSSKEMIPLEESALPHLYYALEDMQEPAEKEQFLTHWLSLQLKEWKAFGGAIESDYNQTLNFSDMIETFAWIKEEFPEILLSNDPSVPNGHQKLLTTYLKIIEETVGDYLRVPLLGSVKKEESLNVTSVFKEAIERDDIVLIEDEKKLWLKHALLMDKEGTSVFLEKWWSDEFLDAKNEMYAHLSHYNHWSFCLSKLTENGQEEPQIHSGMNHHFLKAWDVYVVRKELDYKDSALAFIAQNIESKYLFKKNLEALQELIFESNENMEDKLDEVLCLDGYLLSIKAEIESVDFDSFSDVARKWQEKFYQCNPSFLLVSKLNQLPEIPSNIIEMAYNEELKQWLEDKKDAIEMGSQLWKELLTFGYQNHVSLFETISYFSHNLDEEAMIPLCQTLEEGDFANWEENFQLPVNAELMEKWMNWCSEAIQISVMESEDLSYLFEIVSSKFCPDNKFCKVLYTVTDNGIEEVDPEEVEQVFVDAKISVNTYEEILNFLRYNDKSEQSDYIESLHFESQLKNAILPATSAQPKVTISPRF